MDETGSLDDCQIAFFRRASGSFKGSFVGRPKKKPQLVYKMRRECRPRSVLIVALSALNSFERLYPRQFNAAQKFERRSAAGGDVRDFVGNARGLDGLLRVSSAHNADRA
jgi:hypothetical protein